MPPLAPPSLSVEIEEVVVGCFDQWRTRFFVTQFRSACRCMKRKRSPKRFFLPVSTFAAGQEPAQSARLDLPRDPQSCTPAAVRRQPVARISGLRLDGRRESSGPVAEPRRAGARRIEAPTVCRRLRMLPSRTVLPRLRAEGLRYREIAAVLDISLGAVSGSITALRSR